MFYSPLRYPGGKNKLSKFISNICINNNIDGHYVEPYAGGASVALHLLLEGKMSKITINDYDRSIWAFWRCVLSRHIQLCKMIEETEITIENWKIQKRIQKNKEGADILELGFSTFFLNRANMSGIINAGAIGGIKQEGNYKINCRFNKKVLIERIRTIAKYKKQIHLHNLDALKLIQKIKKESSNQNTIFYFDPPYYSKGSSLYMNHYNDDQHQEISKAIGNIKNIHWIVSYDNAVEIEKIYKWSKNKIKYSFNHSAYKAKEGKELLFFSDTLNKSFDKFNHLLPSIKTMKTNPTHFKQAQLNKTSTLDVELETTLNR
ncbi:DNA-methyltransferase [uncultured Candidatus Thioglobus sp.]|nr:DNA-methyltransferase [uncultured Candidatus Thioglobus sp.]